MRIKGTVDTTLDVSLEDGASFVDAWVRDLFDLRFNKFEDDGSIVERCQRHGGLEFYRKACEEDGMILRALQLIKSKVQSQRNNR
jgi:hypothetical protein